MNKAPERLCDIPIEQNIEINSAIKRKTINWDMIVACNKEAISKIRKLRKKLVNEFEAQPNKPVKIEPVAKPVTATPIVPVNEPNVPKKQELKFTTVKLIDQAKISKRVRVTEIQLHKPVSNRLEPEEPVLPDYAFIDEDDLDEKLFNDDEILIERVSNHYARHTI